MPAHTTVEQILPQATSLETLPAIISIVLSSFDGVSFRSLQSHSVRSIPADPCQDVLVSATGETWTRAARRRKKRGVTMEVNQGRMPTLVCRVVCAAHSQGSPEDAILRCHWVEGRDRGLLESFASHLNSEVLTRTRLTPRR